MSHSGVKFILEDGTTWYGEYNGTSDIMMPEAFPTEQEMEEKWRNHNWSKQCLNPDNCKKEPCTVHNYYGGESEWEAEICRKCGLYIGKDNAYDD